MRPAIGNSGIGPATACPDASWSWRARSGDRPWWPRAGSSVVVPFRSGRGHFGPQEPGQFPGHRDGDDVAAGLADTQPAEPGAQALLGGPRARDGSWGGAVLAG